MPYIELGVKASLEEGRRPRQSGELNYLITRLADAYIVDKGLSYSAINDAIGALECAKLELYRRVAVPYEEKKRSENGEVYINV